MPSQSPLSLKLKNTDATASPFAVMPRKEIPGSKNQNPYTVFNWEGPPLVAGADISTPVITHYRDVSKPQPRVGIVTAAKPGRLNFKVIVPTVSGTNPAPGTQAVFAVTGTTTASLSIVYDGPKDLSAITMSHYLLQQLVNTLVLATAVNGDVIS